MQYIISLLIGITEEERRNKVRQYKTERGERIED